MRFGRELLTRGTANGHFPPPGVASAQQAMSGPVRRRADSGPFRLRGYRFRCGSDNSGEAVRNPQQQVRPRPPRPAQPTSLRCPAVGLVPGQPIREKLDKATLDLIKSRLGTGIHPQTVQADNRWLTRLQRPPTASASSLVPRGSRLTAHGSRNPASRWVTHPREGRPPARAGLNTGASLHLSPPPPSLPLRCPHASIRVPVPILR